MYQIGLGTINPEDVIPEIIRRLQPSSAHTTAEASPKPVVKNFADVARDTAEGVQLQDGSDTRHILHHFASCCNPVPGDEIVGHVTVGSGIKVHRRSCVNVRDHISKNSQRYLEMSWSSLQGGTFIVGARITGDDRAGMLNDITNAIVQYENTNIRSVNIDAFGSEFEGVVTLYVKNLDHLQAIVDRLKGIRGVKSAGRYEG
jgi:(p)ppGpp synthase/HD superfamily hydrolase